MFAEDTCDVTDFSKQKNQSHGNKTAASVLGCFVTSPSTDVKLLNLKVLN